MLYSFGTGTDGAVPLSGVSFDAAGNLYGTTSVGGAGGFGTIFRLTPGAAWTETILHSFQNADDGAYPYAGLVSDAVGNLYGAATQGGTAGGGTVFKLKPSKGGLKFSVLYSVPGWGISGSFRNLLLDDAGNIYGTTHCDGDDSAGTIFKLAPSGGGWGVHLALHLHRRQRRAIHDQQSGPEERQALRNDAERRRERRRRHLHVDALGQGLNRSQNNNCHGPRMRATQLGCLHSSRSIFLRV